ncbi:MAG: type I secretion system permease/ATPase [Gammaproteobacteria bacterium]
MLQNGVAGQQPDTALASLVVMARLYDLPAEHDALKHAFAEPAKGFDSLALLRAAKHLGLKAKAVNCDFNRLKNLSLPAMLQHRDGRWFILAAINEDTALIQNPLTSRPQAVPVKLLEEIWCGQLILFARGRAQPGQKKRFDFSWFIPLLVKYRRLLSEVLLASFFLQLFALMTPIFFQVIIDKVLVHRGLTTLDVLAIGWLAVSLFEVVLGGLRTYVFTHTTNRIDVELGARVFRHLLALPLSYFEARRVGDSVARVKELENIRRFITSSSVTVLIDLLFTGVFLAIMVFYSPLLTLVVLATIPCYVLLSALITPALRTRLHEKFNRGAEGQAFLVEAVSSVETIKAMAAEPQLQRRWEELLAGYVRSAFQATNLTNVAGQVAAFINKVMTVLILWIGARLVIGGALSVGQLVAFNMFAGRVAGPVLRLVQLWHDFQQVGISVQRLGDILNTHPEPQHNSARCSLSPVEGRVSFEAVCFRYPPDGPKILNDVSFDVAPGELIGIVGRSGSGKSTLTKLIQKLYVPQSGRILVDGIDLSLMEPSWLRRQVGVVLQENILFNRSVRENIAFTDPGVSLESVIEAAKLAGAHEFILELKEGYDTVVEEHGANLSGGQRSRIAIARALIGRPKILIFDEATSSLDYESERIIQQNMKAIARRRTVFIIAHRLSAVRNCHRIFVIERGQIAEQGTHEELLCRTGRYARLYALQSNGVISAAAGL